jgi:GT2 family glycosyltransferase
VIVLILSYNGLDLLEDSVSSYLNNEYDCFEVVVIDNGSSDGTEEYLSKRFPEVRVLRTEQNLKYSGGLNLGLSYAFNTRHTDYALISNNDVVADKHLISSLVTAAISDRSIGFVIGKVYYHSKPEYLQTVGKRYDPILWNGGHIGNKEKDLGQYDQMEERAWCDDIYWLVSREVYSQTGGYDTEFAFQGEDFDWQVRAKLKGFKIMYTPKAKLWHKESMTIGKTSAFKAYYDTRNPLIIHMKYRSPKQFRIFFRIRIKNIISGMIKNAAKFRYKHVYAMLRGCLSALYWGVTNKKLSLRHFI